MNILPILHENISATQYIQNLYDVCETKMMNEREPTASAEHARAKVYYERCPFAVSNNHGYSSDVIKFYTHGYNDYNYKGIISCVSTDQQGKYRIELFDGSIHEHQEQYLYFGLIGRKMLDMEIKDSSFMLDVLDRIMISPTLITGVLRPSDSTEFSG